MRAACLRRAFAERPRADASPRPPQPPLTALCQPPMATIAGAPAPAGAPPGATDPSHGQSLVPRLVLANGQEVHVVRPYGGGHAIAMAPPGVAPGALPFRPPPGSMPGPFPPQIVGGPQPEPPMALVVEQAVGAYEHVKQLLQVRPHPPLLPVSAPRAPRPPDPRSRRACSGFAPRPRVADLRASLTLCLLPAPQHLLMRNGRNDPTERQMLEGQLNDANRAIAQIRTLPTPGPYAAAQAVQAPLIDAAAASAHGQPILVTAPATVAAPAGSVMAPATVLPDGTQLADGAAVSGTVPPAGVAAGLPPHAIAQVSAPPSSALISPQTIISASSTPFSRPVGADGSLEATGVWIQPSGLPLQPSGLRPGVTAMIPQVRDLPISPPSMTFSDLLP